MEFEKKPLLEDYHFEKNSVLDSNESPNTI